MENFEAVGRYTVARDKAFEFAIERDKSLSAIKNICEKSIVTYQLGKDYFRSREFYPEKIEELLRQAGEANRNMIAAVEEANRNAEAAGKSKLVIDTIN